MATKRKRSSKGFIPRKRTRRRTSIGTRAQLDILRKQMGEKKGVDTPVNAQRLYERSDATYGFDTNTQTTVLNLIQPGNGSWNRIGRKVFNKSIEIKGHIRVSIGSTDTFNQSNGTIIRLLLIWDKQPSGNAIPTVEQILGSTSQTGVEGSSSYASLKYDVMGRFQIIKDKWITINPTASPPSSSTGEKGTVEMKRAFKIYKILGRETNFSGESNPATIADINTGALYFFGIEENDGPASSTTSRISYLARLRYID